MPINHCLFIITKNYKQLPQISPVQEEACFGVNVMYQATLQASESHYRSVK